MSGVDDSVILDLVERARTRFFGKYAGTVTDVDDATLRIKAKVPAVLSDQTSGWCLPCVPYAGKSYGIAFLPEVGSAVWIEFEGGDVSRPIWAGCFWRDGEQPSDAKGTVKVLATKGGAKIVIDDDAPSIVISDGNDNEITIDSNGIKLKRKSKVIEIGDSSVKVNDGALEVM
jgi:uncharacterized protein involved in type VI secretion and phage assembly